MRAGKLILFDYNFADFAQHSGGIGIKVTEPSELEAAVEKALKAANPRSWTLTLTQKDSSEEKT